MFFDRFSQLFDLESKCSALEVQLFLKDDGFLRKAVFSTEFVTFLENPCGSPTFSWVFQVFGTLGEEVQDRCPRVSNKLKTWKTWKTVEKVRLPLGFSRKVGKLDENSNFQQKASFLRKSWTSRGQTVFLISKNIQKQHFFLLHIFLTF